MLHISLSPRERTQLDGRWHNQPAPLCATGDGHWQGVNPAEWNGQHPRITCANCIAALDDPYTFAVLGKPGLGEGRLAILSMKDGLR